MFIDITSLPTEQLQKDLRHECQYRPQSEINFVTNHLGDVAVFLSGPERYTGLFLITDSSFTPKVAFSTKAYINACALSDNGDYAICQTANSPLDPDDSGVFIVLDLRKREVISKILLPTGWKGMTHLYIDEIRRSFWVYYNETKFEYDFAGVPTDKESFIETRLSMQDGYQRLALADSLIAEISRNFDAQLEEKIWRCLDGIDESVSTYQQSMTYKALGECYAVYGERDKAIRAFERGVALNPKLTVKKALKALRKG